ncbi:hypothetical protein PsorP6_017449 [Peronosclerospora sorghi]|uniref:Uncharacterized protein n=1 Tax=Peronosclerospora sorghi TaxID=230839 RepID=A0ACC0WM68_9STRA|nr:hypothetical protein PsorP6_017449 [Peronosclerospora sorghi]
MSAWEQWGGKKPASGGLQSAQDALHNLLGLSPLSTSSTMSVSSDESAHFSLKKAWSSAREFAKNAVAASPASDNLVDTMENGSIHGRVEDTTTAQRPLWTKKSTSQEGLIPTISW